MASKAPTVPIARFRLEELNGKFLNGGRERKMTLMWVTPDLATEWLNRNTRNRPLSSSTVQRYVKDSKEGRWRSTAQPVVFDWDGDLLDGQHRLFAIVESGIAMQLWIATGEDPATFPAYDRGRKRTAGDAMALTGHKDYNLLAATAARLRRHERGVAWSTVAIDRYVNVEEVLEVLEAHPSLSESARRAKRLTKAPPSLTAFLHYLFAQKDRDAADWFIEAVATGVGLSGTDGAYLLRNRLLENRDKKAKLPEKEIAALFIKAWNAHREKRPIRNLRWRTAGEVPEAFPEIV